MDAIVDLDGKLAIRSPLTRSDKPEVQIVYYPTGIKTRRYPHLVGARAEYSHIPGRWVLPEHDFMGIRAEHGGDTRPCKTETETIPPPGRGGKDWGWVWYNSRWEKRNR